MMKKILSIILITAMVVGNVPYLFADNLEFDTLRPASGAKSSIDDEISKILKQSPAGEELLLTIKSQIAQNPFLHNNTTTDLIKRIEDNPDKQEFTLKVLGLLVSHYLWVNDRYGKGAELAQIEKDIYNPMISCLAKISERLEQSDLVGNAVTLKLSENDTDVVRINISGRRAKIGFLPMKGDPWQMGHLWTILELLAGGCDTVVIMLDNSEPRKPDLTALSIREADSVWLFETLKPFVLYTSFQKEYRPLFTRDGETILPTLIYENRTIANQVIWLYDAGYDHFNWTVKKKDEVLLDVPYKLCFDLQQLFIAGIDAKINAKFQKRGDDSMDTAEQVHDRTKALEAVVAITIIEFFTDMVDKWVSKKTAEIKSDFWNDVRRWIAEQKNQLILDVTAKCDQRQNLLIDKMRQGAKEALKGESSENKKVHEWLNGFEATKPWQSVPGSTGILEELLMDLERIEQTKNRFIYNTDVKAKVWADKFVKMISERNLMDFEVIDQPMNTSSTKVRKAGELHTLAGVLFADSVIGLRRYPAYQAPATDISDKNIATNILAGLADINLIASGKETTQITIGELQKHLGENLAPLVDMDLLVRKLNERLLKGDLDSALYYSGQQLEDAMAGIRRELTGAYGNALHIVDNYVMKFYIEDNALKRLTEHIGGQAAGDLQQQARERINIVRSLIRERAGEIVTESRKAHLSAVKASPTGEKVSLPSAKDQQNQINEAKAIIGKIAGAKISNKADLVKFIGSLDNLNSWYNYMDVSSENRKLYNEVLVAKSNLARELAKIVTRNYPELIGSIKERSRKNLEACVEHLVKKGKMERIKGDDFLRTSKTYIEEWLDKRNGIPDHIVTGLIRGMIEGRSEDILYDFGNGWRQFGTAGIRNEAVQSNFEAILRLELDEFAKDPHAPILTGPNCINSVTLLQQVATMANLSRQLREKIEDAEKTGQALDIDPEYVDNIKRNTVTLTYDSRLNGKYYAHLLAAAFLESGINVNLMDSPSGVPAGAIISKGHTFFGDMAEDTPFFDVKGSMFGALISASHSEAWFNGFKLFIGHLKSQLDAASKKQVMDARGGVEYSDMHLDLANKNLGYFDTVFRANSEKLTWLGAENPRSDVNYCGAKFIPFYPLYYKFLKEQKSPCSMLPENMQSRIAAQRETLKALYTAVFGVGAVEGANLPAFLRDEIGYKSLRIIKAQTDIMDGRFPGHIMPDPGVVIGWTSNLLDYAKQMAGDDLSDIDAFIEEVNSLDVSGATDPDIDRFAALIPLEGKAKGNIKDALIEKIKQYLYGREDIDKTDADKIIAKLQNNLKEPQLLTANDAWAFIFYHKLKLMEERGLLDKNKLYIVLKSHVTTLALERIAELYRKKGYHIYVVDTYVGFTELAKKSRDLFKIAKISWQINQALLKNENTDKLLPELKAVNAVLKANVPYETRGVPLIDDLVIALEKNELDKAKELSNIIAHMEIPIGVEESNGYGEFGRYIPEKDAVVLSHIAEKDGSLALFEFFELISYGKATGRTAYDMYKEMIKDTGSVATDNQFLINPGLTGQKDKEDEIESIEKILAAIIQKRLDNGNRVLCFDGKYEVKKVIIYRDNKYDEIYRGFPEEGVRFILENTKTKSSLIVTYRSSGTGNSNRDYNWILGVVPGETVDLDKYKNTIDAELFEMTGDFFGEPADAFGDQLQYASPEKGKFNGLLAALKQAGKRRHIEMFNKAFDSIRFTDAEAKLHKIVEKYCFVARDPKNMTKDQREEAERQLPYVTAENYQAWSEYLAAQEAQEYPNKVRFLVNGKLKAEIPKAFAMAWQGSVVGYLSSLLKETGLKSATISCDDAQIADYVKERTPGIEITIADNLRSSSAGKSRVSPFIDIDEGTDIYAFDYEETLAKTKADITGDVLQELIARLKAGKRIAIISGLNIYFLDKHFGSHIPQEIRKIYGKQIFFMGEFGTQIATYNSEGNIEIDTANSKPLSQLRKEAIAKPIYEVFDKRGLLNIEGVTTRTKPADDPAEYPEGQSIEIGLEKYGTVCVRLWGKLLRHMPDVAEDLMEPLGNMGVKVAASNNAIDISPIDKGEALIKLLEIIKEKEGISIGLDKVAVFGDSQGDYPMLSLKEVNAFYVGGLKKSELPKKVAEKVHIPPTQRGPAGTLGLLRAGLLSPHTHVSITAISSHIETAGKANAEISTAA